MGQCCCHITRDSVEQEEEVNQKIEKKKEFTLKICKISFMYKKEPKKMSPKIKGNWWTNSEHEFFVQHFVSCIENQLVTNLNAFDF